MKRVPTPHHNESIDRCEKAARHYRNTGDYHGMPITDAVVDDIVEINGKRYGTIYLVVPDGWPDCCSTR